MMLTREQIISKLKLKPHLTEGGYYNETYRSPEQIPIANLPLYSAAESMGTRSLATAIYYLLTPDTFSAMHRLPTEEIFHFYLGDPVEMLLIEPDGRGKIVTLGTDLMNGMQPQVVVPRNVWQGARLVSGGKFALLGTTMSPGFEFSDYETGKKEELEKLCPEFRERIERLAIPG